MCMATLDALAGSGITCRAFIDLSGTREQVDQAVEKVMGDEIYIGQKKVGVVTSGTFIWIASSTLPFTPAPKRSGTTAATTLR